MSEKDRIAYLPLVWLLYTLGLRPFEQATELCLYSVHLTILFP